MSTSHSSKGKILRHIVTFKQTHHKEKEINDFGAVLVNLKSQLPGILSISWSKSESSLFEGHVDRSHGYTHVLVVDFASLDAYKTYGPSAPHQKAIADFEGTFERSTVVVLDFWIDA